MATTTNFGWETPDDTDLVKDGAAAMRTLGNSIDTSFVDLKGGTTNQVLAKNSNTDLDFKWVADATGIPATIIDAKGDLIAGTAADTAGRLAVGTNGQYLSADSAESTGLKWVTPSSGSMTLLSTTTLNSTSITIGSGGTISQDYTHLQLYIADWYTSGTPSGGGIFLRVNSNTTSPNYVYPQIYSDNAGSVATQGGSGSQLVLQPANPAYADNNNVCVVNFNFYTSSLQKSGHYVNNYKSASGASPHISVFGSFSINEQSAITSITLLGNSTITGTAYLYGVK